MKDEYLCCYSCTRMKLFSSKTPNVPRGTLGVSLFICAFNVPRGTLKI